MEPSYPAAASRLLRRSPEILARWDRQVREQIPSTRGERRPALRNNLGVLLQEVATHLDPARVRRTARVVPTISADHGGQRARFTPYSMAELFLEYRLLRRTVLEVLSEGQSLSSTERELINDALEHAVQEAVTEFARVQQEAEVQRRQEAQALTTELRAAYDRERRIAQILQRPLLLKVAENAFDGLSIATWYEPVLAEAEVGGDFLDVFALPDGWVAVAVGDACGKGLEAAVHNTHVRDLLRAFLREAPGRPGAALARVNDALCETIQAERPGSFVTLALALFRPEQGELIVAAAGAEPSVVIRAGGACEIPECGGLVLGVHEGQVYDECRVQLAAGDTVLLLTDGLTEARNAGGFLGHSGVVRLAGQSSGAPTLAGAGQALLDGVHAYSAGPLRDDACLVLVRKR